MTTSRHLWIPGLALACAVAPAFAGAAPTTVAEQDAVPTLAVLDLAFSPGTEDLAARADDALTAEFIATGTFTVVERRRIEHVIREQALGQTGIVSEKSAIKVGELVGANMLVMGRLSCTGGGFHLDIRMVSAESGRIHSVAGADFAHDTNLRLTVRQVVRSLLEGEKPASTGATRVAVTSSSEREAELVVDPSKTRDAAADIARQVGQKFGKIRARLDAVDDAGRGTFKADGYLVFPGLRMAIYGVDSVTGEQAIRGYLLVDDADPPRVSGRTTSTTEPCEAGNEAVSLPFHVAVHGPSGETSKALSEAINGLMQFSADPSAATQLDLQFELRGSTVGERHLAVRVLNKDAHILASFESSLTL